MKAQLTYLFLTCSTIFLLLSPAFAQRNATILDHKDRVRISPIKILNSSARETNLSITPDGKYLYFMSLRGGQSWSHKYMTFGRDSVYDGDIWYSQKVGGEWQRPQCLPYGINTSQGEDEPNVSPDGQRVYFQSWNYIWRETGGPYYQAQRSGRTWSRPRGLGGGITEFFKIYPATDGMSISQDEATFIVAAGPDYEANMNLYMSRKGKYGWTYCRKLPISTSGNDRSVFIAADSKTVYFASDGYKGFGGLDIYKATLINDSTFGEVINIGAPFNTPGDDYGFILTGDGNEAYFVRDGDIHFADLKEADDRIKPTIPVVRLTLKGIVKDKASWTGIPAEVLLLDAYTKQIVKRFQTDSKGQYSLEIDNRDRLYDQIVTPSIPGYAPSRKRLSVEKQFRDETISSNFLLEPEAVPLAEIHLHLKGTVMDQRSKKGIPAQIIIRDLASNKVIQQFDTSPNGQYETEIPNENARYEQVAVSIGYLPTERLLSVSQRTKEESIQSDFALEVKPEPIPVVVEEVTPVIQDVLPPTPPMVEKVEEDPYSFNGVAENNLILLLDVSASMKKPEKLPVLKSSLMSLLQHMRPEDQISVVVYSGDARVVLDGVSAASQQLILETIDDLRSGGSTKGKEALRKAYKVAENNYIPSGNNRIILATDGYFDIPDLYSIVSKNSSDTNVCLSVFSFGKLNQDKLDELAHLAQLGKGNFANITEGNVDQALLTEAKAVRK